MNFDFDPEKAKENESKHAGVTFAEAVFDDLNSVEFFDDAHSQNEMRFQRLGFSTKRLLFVVYTIRDENQTEIIRLISARKATAKEIQIYNEYNSGERIDG